MKTLSASLLFLIPLFGDAMFSSWKKFWLLLGAVILILVIARYAGRKIDQWEKEKEKKREQEFDESKLY